MNILSLLFTCNIMEGVPYFIYLSSVFVFWNKNRMAFHRIVVEDSVLLEYSAASG